MNKVIGVQDIKLRLKYQNTKNTFTMLVDFNFIHNKVNILIGNPISISSNETESLM